MLASVKDVFAPERKMKNNELKEYLNTFPNEADVCILLANPRERKLYEVEQIELVVDIEQPVIGVIVGKESNMDSDLVEACEECEQDEDKLSGQMYITDYPEVLP